MKPGKIKILIVDDSDVMLRVITEYFRPYNVSISTSINGLDGIKKATETKPDLILLDLLMPNFDGLKMLQVIKLLDELKHIPVIVISANTDKTNVLSAIEAGADQVLAKPVKRDLLITAVEKSLGKPVSFKPDVEAEAFEETDAELKEQLRKSFVNSFNNEKNSLNESLLHKNIPALKYFAHNTKSIAHSIGHPQLLKINTEIEKLFENPEANWQLIQIKFNQVFAIIKDVENSLAAWKN